MCIVCEGVCLCTCVGAGCAAHLDCLLLVDGPEGFGEKHRAVLSQGIQLHTHLGGVLERKGGRWGGSRVFLYGCFHFPFTACASDEGAGGWRPGNDAP